ncbi:SpoIIE family protein phosphatase [Crocinitomicaceae bacterium]|nr:SpoIIE family protein phosphatase [Crocinitomicaceae bacterium]
MKQCLLLVLFFTIAFGSFSQPPAEPDSAEVALHKKSINDILLREKGKLHDSVVADYYMQLAEYASNDYDYNLAINYCDSALINESLLSFEQRIELTESKANYLRSNGKTGDGIKLLLAILKELEAKKRYDLSAILNKRIGTIYLKMSELATAEYHLKTSIRHAKKVKDLETEGYARMSLGNRYKTDSLYVKAEEQYNLSIAIGKQLGDKRMLAGNYNNFGSLLRLQKKNEESRKYYLKAVEMNMASGNDKWLSYNYNNLGNLSNDEKKYQEALNYFLQSIEIKDRLGDFRGKVYTLSNVAGAYESLGNFKEAYSYQKEYSVLLDSVAKLDNITDNKKLAAQFQAEKREDRIRQLAIQDKYNQDKIDNQKDQLSYQNTIAWILSIGIVLVFIIAILLWRTTVNRKRINAELVEKNAQIDRQHREIIDSINYASRIQNSILPGNEHRKQLLPDHAILFKPKDIISGDFYVCESSGDQVFFGTVDCTGHGVPGAMVSLVASSHINKAIHEYELKKPGDILTRLNDEIPNALNGSDESINDGMDMAMCVLDLGAMRMDFAGAYQNCWLLSSKESLDKRDTFNLNAVLHEGNGFSLLELKGERRGIGRSTIQKPFVTQSLELAKGDVILLASDGYQDQFGGPRNKKFKVKELRNLVLSQAGSSPVQIVNSLDTTLRDWMEKTYQIDDVCVFVVRV